MSDLPPPAPNYLGIILGDQGAYVLNPDCRFTSHPHWRPDHYTGDMTAATLRAIATELDRLNASLQAERTACLKIHELPEDIDNA